MVQSKDKSISSRADRPTLDEAIQECIEVLENGSPATAHSLVARFPEWEKEVAEFLENWGGMERYADLITHVSHTSEPNEPHRPGSRFGDYELLEKIGIGGMGVIYKARQISLDRIVAVKMFHDQRRDRDRFRIEAEAAAALSHPNIVSIYEVGEHQGQFYFSMQFIQGCNLKEYLDGQAISQRQAARITETIAKAVHYAHQRGILHRDLKPANVLMDVQGQPHVTDFGLAKHIERDNEITRSGTILGTPGYMAPEQATGKIKNLTTSTDVYGLGAVLYSLLAGEAPFTGDSPLEVLRRVVDEPPTSPRIRRPDISRDLETICLKCLEKSPELRYASPELLADDLSRFINHLPVKARPISTVERFSRWCSRNPAISMLSGLVAVLLVVTTVASFLLALSERNARLLSEYGSEREKKLLGDVGSAEHNEQVAREVATRSRAELYMSNGLWQARNRNVSEALLWFSEAAALTLDEPTEFRRKSISFQSWLRQHPMPIAATMLKEVHAEAWLGSTHAVVFRPNAPQILCKDGSEFVVWSYDRGELWQLGDSYPGISDASWSPEGSLLAIGCDDGKVALVHPDSRRLTHEFHLEGSVDHLVFSNDGSTLAIASGKIVRIWNVATQQFVGEDLVHTKSVVQLIFSAAGNQLVTVIAPRRARARVFSIDGNKIEQTCEVPCFPLDNVDSWRPFWPRFVNGDAALMVRTRRQVVTFYDPATGQELGQHTLPGAAYANAMSGQVLVTAGDNHAEVRQVSLTEQGLIKSRSVERLVHKHRVSTTDVSSQELIATGGWDRNVRVWPYRDRPSKEPESADQAIPLAVLPHQTRVAKVVFSADGTLLATVQIDGLARLWQIPHFEQVGYGLNVPEGGSLAKLVDEDRWMISGMTKWTGHVANATVHINADGRFDGGTTEHKLADYGHLLDAASFLQTDQLATVHAGKNRSGISISRTDGTAGSLRFWNCSNGRALHGAIPMPSEPRSVEFNPNGQQVAVCTAKMEVLLVNTETFDIETTLRPVDQTGKVLVRRAIFPSQRFNGQLAYSPDGKTLVAWGSGDGLWVWDVEQQRLRFPCIENSDTPVESVHFSPDGRRVALACGRNTVARILDIESGQFVCSDLKHSSFVHSAKFSPDGAMLITGCRDGQSRLFNAQTGDLVLKDLWHDSDVVDAAFTPDSRHLLTLGNDQLLRVWHASDGSLAMKPFKTPLSATQLLLTPDSRFAIVAGGQKEIRVFDLSELHQRSTGDLARFRLIAELLANKTIRDGAIVNLNTTEWYSKWTSYSINSPAQ